MKVFERDSPAYARDVDKLQKNLEDSRSFQNIPEENRENYKKLEDSLNATYFCKEVSHWVCLLCNKKYTAKFTVKDHIYKLRCNNLTREHIEIIKEKVKFDNYKQISSMELNYLQSNQYTKSNNDNNEKEEKQIINLEPLDIANNIIPQGNKKVTITRKSQKQTNINNGTINNTINNNTNIVLVNPLGLETLTHTTKDIYKKILKGGETNIVRYLLEAIYSKQENQNFFKDNKNQPHIAYIDDNYTIKYIHESQLKFFILKNIPSKIEQLLYINKNKMKQEEVIRYLTHAINIEKNFIGLDNKFNPNYKNLIDIGNAINTVIRTHGVKDNIIYSQDLFTTNEDNVNKVIDEIKTIKNESHNEFNDKSKSTVKELVAPEKEEEIKVVKKPNRNNVELDEEDLLELTGYDLTAKNKKKNNTKVSSTDKKEEVNKSLYDLKTDLSIQYDKTFTCNLNTL